MFGGGDAMLLLAIILFIAGFILLGIEMVIPGFSIPGITGIILLVLGIFLASDSVAEGAVITLIILVLLVIMFAVILGLLSKGKLKPPIVLEEEQKKTKGYISSSDLNYLLGKKGYASTDLRPAGSGNFDGIEFDVLSESRYINKGTKIVIFKVQGSKLIVKEDE